MTTPVFNQNGFRYYLDDGAHGTTGLPAENANHSMDADTNIILRIEVEVTNSKSNNELLTLYAQKNNTGGYTEVTQTSTNGIQFELSANFADGDADNNNRLTSSSLTFTGGVMHENTPMGGTSPAPDGMDFAGTDHWEVDCCIAIDSAQPPTSGDFWDFEIRDNAGAQLGGYTRRPRLTYTPPPDVDSLIPLIPWHRRKQDTRIRR